MARWIEKSPEFVAARYNRFAPVYGLLDWLQGIPLVGLRRKAVAALRLKGGDAVLEVGCGDGRCFYLLQGAVGSAGRIIGIDLSPKMLAGAYRLARRRGWSNVELHCVNAAEFTPPQPIQGALLTLSYCTMRDRSAILRRVWDLVEPGGRLVIADVMMSPGIVRNLFGWVGVLVSNLTLLGKPDIEPRSDLASIAGQVEYQRIRPFPFLTQFEICAAAKSKSNSPDRPGNHVADQPEPQRGKTDSPG
jgi:demethylmenaquinone methyltransferase/2-methoxy-6-polyprenyl-1,4-benzoquinol methylase